MNALNNLMEEEFIKLPHSNQPAELHSLIFHRSVVSPQPTRRALMLIGACNKQGQLIMENVLLTT